MLVKINSVWLIKNLDGILDGKYRVLASYSVVNQLVLFKLNDSNGLIRPVLASLTKFVRAIEQNDISPVEFELPYYQQVDNNKIDPKHLLKRDKKYAIIKELVEEPYFLFDLCTQKRSPQIIKQSKINSVAHQTIYRALNLYWKYGQDKNALLPAYNESGGRNKTREAGNIKRGCKSKSKTGVLSQAHGINITSADQNKILKGLKKYYLGPKKLTLKKAYQKTLRQYYAAEIEKASIENSYPAVPSYRQFIYWKSKLIAEQEELKRRTTESDYLKNKRGVLKSATHNSPVPGSCFEIDATVADVHIVSELQRNQVLGRPTLYTVTDKASRMIVGIHLSLEYASWRAARQALINSFLPKSSYCARYDIDISDADWPCAHIPQRLLCDRGEMICKNAEELVVPLMILEIAPPYRPDLKGIVEHDFDFLNKEAIHELVGTTKGKQFIRGDKDPRQSAIYTLNEVTHILINAVLEHNRTILDELATSSRLLIENDLPATPLNFWKIHLAKHRHVLKHVDEIDVRAKLLPAEQVSMTRNGIKYGEIYYSCKRIEQEDWAAQARSNGRWKLEARVDVDNTNCIFVRLKDNESFTPCYLLPPSKMMKNLPFSDIYYLQDWQQSKKKKQPISVESIATHHELNSIEVNAKKEAKNAKPLKNKAAKTANMRERRKQAVEREIMERNNEFQPEDVAPTISNQTNKNVISNQADHDVISMKNEDLITLLKRQQED